MDASILKHGKHKNERNNSAPVAEGRRAEQAARVAAIVARGHGYTALQVLTI